MADPHGPWSDRIVCGVSVREYRGRIYKWQLNGRRWTFRSRERLLKMEWPPDGPQLTGEAPCLKFAVGFSVGFEASLIVTGKIPPESNGQEKRDPGLSGPQHGG